MTSPTKFFSSNSNISMREAIITKILQEFLFFLKDVLCSSNLGLALGMTLKFYASLSKRVKTKSHKVLGANS